MLGTEIAVLGAMDTSNFGKTIENLEESIELSGKMMDLVERGVEGCQDDGCLVVYGIMRDCAFKIRSSAQKELQEHRKAYSTSESSR